MSELAITARIRGQLDQLGEAHRLVAKTILAAPAECAAMSIRTLAQTAGVSQATVSRFCRVFGLHGYPELRLALAAEQGRSAPQAEGDIAEGDDLASVVRKIARLDAQAVVDTAHLLDLENLSGAIDALSRAHRTCIYAVGASAVVAADLAQKLTRIGRGAFAYGDAHMGITSAAVLGPEDVAVAFSHSGTTADTCAMLLTAKDQGAVTIAVTNNASSPLARMADHTLLTAAHEAVFRSGATASRLAQLVVVDCMFVGLAQATFAESQTALEATYHAVRQRGISPGKTDEKDGSVAPG
ncbi:MAG TPA: MurR/RpiR family transcriptional regulator [Beutenbergiaceae bacterium]|nr:MurR/RpiR family transcriptional regulator [Beutenbergiaceae bacterium]